MFVITEKHLYYGNDQLPAYPNAKQQRQKSDYPAHLCSARLSIRIQSGIWDSPKRWGKKNGITIPTIPGEEQEMLLQKKELLKRLTAYIEDEINKVEDKNAIDKIWGEKKVRTFYKPTKAPKERQKNLFSML